MISISRVDLAVMLAAAGFTSIHALPTGALSVRTLAGDGVNSHQDGTGTHARLTIPRDIQYDSITNKYYFYSQYAIRMMDPTTNVVTTIAGNGVAGDGGSGVDGSSAAFGEVYQIAIHPTAGYLLVPDRTYHKIRRVMLTSPYTVTTISGNGAPGSGDGTPVSSATYTDAYGISFSPDGNHAIVSEQTQNRLRMLNLQTDTVTTLASGQFSTTPTHITHLSNTEFLVTDYDAHRIRHVTTGGVVTNWCGDGTAGNANGDCTGGAKLTQPTSIYYSSSDSAVFFTQGNHIIRRVSLGSPNTVSYVAGRTSTSGFNDGPATGALFNIPFGMTSSPDGTRLLVADTATHRIRELYSTPTASPTYAPASEHIYVHAMDLHGDGWGDDLFLMVQHANTDDDGVNTPEFYSLNCACKAIRLFSTSGDMTISMYSNSGVEYTWEALFTLGYSDGVNSEKYNVIGGVNTEIVFNDWEIESVTNDLLYESRDSVNMCTVPGKPKPKASPAASNATDNAPKPKPDPLALVSLTLGQSAWESWCDDSYNWHDVSCSAEHSLTPDARLPNILAYPRYYISEAGTNNIVKQDTLRNGTVSEVTTVKLPRDGSFVFSVSGHDLFDSGSATWSFCGESGGLGERLSFEMVKGECVAGSVESIPSLSCENEWSSSVSLPLSHNIMKLHDSAQLVQERYEIHVFAYIAFMFAAVAAALLLIPASRKLWSWHQENKSNISLDCIEDSTFECVADDLLDDLEMASEKKPEKKKKRAKKAKSLSDETVSDEKKKRDKKSKSGIIDAQSQFSKKVVSYNRVDDVELPPQPFDLSEWQAIKNVYDQDPAYEHEAY